MSENVESGIADDVTETPAAAGAEGQEGIADEEKNDGGIADLPKETPPGESEKEPEAPKETEPAEADKPELSDDAIPVGGEPHDDAQ